MRNTTLDTRDLNRRLEELKDLRTAVEDATTTSNEAREALNSRLPGDDEDEEIKDELTEAVEEAQSALDNATGDFGDEEKEELAEL